jgi:hypothetical protein
MGRTTASKSACVTLALCVSVALALSASPAEAGPKMLRDDFNWSCPDLKKQVLRLCERCASDFPKKESVGLLVTNEVVGPPVGC